VSPAKPSRPMPLLFLPINQHVRMEIIHHPSPVFPSSDIALRAHVNIEIVRPSSIT
jgi:hypothetical protein